MCVLHLPLTEYDAIRRHGEETYPHECCGALLGRNTGVEWHVARVVRAGNASVGSTHTRYSIAPIELVQIEREARRQGLEIAGFYHSHPDHPAQGSQTDLAEAHWIGCVYVITSVVNGKVADTQSYLLAGTKEEDKQFQLQTIHIIRED